jgi:hypothetical protein
MVAQIGYAMVYLELPLNEMAMPSQRTEYEYVQIQLIAKMAVDN